ncbi:TIGR02281 family clan AA aspartic protease [Bradyrhizobium sp. LHD-71]|uniref:TIGR02281 family clan AA aspartic protease n=1 Tax=Bradyrhizobium sp. LHD-71 TaxID=3072141 RepID=UPI00280DC83D|nr:TIGR02281 family clan AA aspartic protease [Bradyrhizobium sp. LHD-71]MDQ8727275.1 TIGR02281 family clan AA aspartic protease [Bradyrhizobium sp. LHD-71]
MRNILIFAIILTGLGVYMAWIADDIPATIAAASTQGRAPSPYEPPADAGRRSHVIAKDSRGHFSTDGRVDGRRLGFMVDTGASVIALTEASAAQVGIRPSRSDYNAPVTTANGVVKAARARLASVDIGGLEVRDVEAMILPDGVLSENLLGLSYLSRLRRFEYAGGKLMLEQ